MFVRWALDGREMSQAVTTPQGGYNRAMKQDDFTHT